MFRSFLDALAFWAVVILLVLVMVALGTVIALYVLVRDTVWLLVYGYPCRPWETETRAYPPNTIWPWSGASGDGCAAIVACKYSAYREGEVRELHSRN